MLPRRELPIKLFKLTNATVKKADEITSTDFLIGEDGSPKRGEEGLAKVIAKIYEVDQFPYGENYILNSTEKLALMLLAPPRVSCSKSESKRGGRRRNEVSESESSDSIDGEYNIEGCDPLSFEIIKIKASTKELALRLSRDFLQPGDKIEIEVLEYIKRSKEWKNLFGGYYLPTGVSGAKNSPFLPSDVAYLIPKSRICLTLGMEDRRKALRSFIDVFGLMKEDGVMFTAPSATLRTVRELAKSIGFLPSKSPDGKLFISFNRKLDIPLAYPIEVKYAGEHEVIITPGREKVLLEDGTVSFW